MSLKDRLLHFFFPKTCVHCRRDLKPLENGCFCGGCLGRVLPILPLFCRRCGVPLPHGGAHCPACRGTSKRFQCSLIRAVYPYGEEIQSLLHAMKYRKKRYLARFMVEAMASAWERYAELKGCEILVPVPLHPRRRRERGFNQALVLADQLSPRIMLPAREVLERNRNTRPQWQLDRLERGSNVEGAFSLKPGGALGVKSCLLIDDLCTTGATLENCARTLKKAGVRRVHAFVFARQTSGQGPTNPPGWRADADSS